MNSFTILSIKCVRKIFSKLFPLKIYKPDSEQDPKMVSQIIYNALISNEPCMIGRFGAFELSTMVNYLGVKNRERKYWSYIQGKSQDWWWNRSLLNAMHINAGFFPPTIPNIEKFCELMVSDLKELDVLGSWLENENYFQNLLNVRRVRLLFLEPFWTELSWMRALEHKKVLIVHPFKETIMKQYEKRDLLFQNKTILPQFKSIKVIKAVQSLGGESDSYKDWFKALDSMKLEIDNSDYDICLIGCGAYGFPLAAHVKRQGKKAVHLGGALQLVFGIRGKRWEDESYGEQTFGRKNVYNNLMNQFWVKPMLEEKPAKANQVEGGCYW